MEREAWITKTMRTMSMLITTMLGLCVHTAASTDITSGAHALASPSALGMELRQQRNKLGGLYMRLNKLRGQRQSPDSEGSSTALEPESGGPILAPNSCLAGFLGGNYGQERFTPRCVWGSPTCPPETLINIIVLLFCRVWVLIGAPKGGCCDQGLFSNISSRGFHGFRGSSKYWNLQYLKGGCFQIFISWLRGFRGSHGFDQI